MSKDTPRVIDERTLRQLTEWAINAHPRRMSMLWPAQGGIEGQRWDGAHDAAIRTLAIVIGGTYHVGYDRAANDAWNELCKRVREVIGAAANDTPAQGNIDARDRAVYQLIILGRETGAETVRHVWLSAMPLDARQRAARDADGYFDGCEVHRDPVLSCAEDHPDA